MKSHIVNSLFVVFTAPLLVSFCVADDWPQFLGQNRDGKSTELGLVSSWPKDGLKETWRKKLGPGMSGIAIVNDQLVTMFQDDRQQYVICLNASNGNKRWKTAVAPTYQNSMGHGPRATPTISNGIVYAYTGEGILASLDLKSGKEIWKVDLRKSNGGKPAEYGTSGSPVVLDDEVIVPTNPGKYSICSFAKEDGKFLWGTNDEVSGYASPMFLDSNAGKSIAMFSGKSLFGVEPGSGRLIWQYDFPTEYNCNTASPINIGKNIFVSSGENHGSALLSVDRTDGRWKVTEVWKSFGRDSVLRCEWQTPIFHNGYVFGFDNVGSAGPATHLSCIDAKTGKRMWQKVRFGKGNMIFADDKLLISTMKGELVIVNATSAKFEELGRQKIIGQTRQAPAISSGKVYLRDQSEIVCIDLAK